MPGGRSVRDELFGIDFGVLSLVTVDSVLHLTAEVTDETLHWPGSGITKCANSVTLDLEGEFLKHIDLSEVGVTLLNTSKHVNHPPSPLAAWCALTTALVLIELSQTKNSVNYVSLVVHNYNCSGTKTTLNILESIEVHHDITADSLGYHRYRRTARDNCLQVIPTTNNSTAMSVNKLLKRNRHLFLNSDRVINVATYTEQFSTLVLVATESGEPRGTTSHDCRNNGDSLYICDGSRATVESSISREGRLHSGFTGLALKTFDQS